MRILSVCQKKMRLWVIPTLIIGVVLMATSPAAEAGLLRAAHEPRFVGVPLVKALGTWRHDASDGGSLSSKGGGESGTGAIESLPFDLDSSEVVFELRGWNGPDGRSALNRCEIIDETTGEVLGTALPPQDDRPHKVAVTMTDHVGKSVRIRLCDENAGAGYAWMAVDVIDAGSGFHKDFAGEDVLADWHIVNDGTDGSLRVGNHYGVPYLGSTSNSLPEEGILTINLGMAAKELLFIGMTSSHDMGVPGWHYPSDHSLRFFVGDQLGAIRVVYADGERVVYPLILGDSLWWGKRFTDFPRPFEEGSPKARMLGALLSLYPAYPHGDAKYLAVIKPRRVPIDRIEIVDGVRKRGTPIIEALTVTPCGAGDLPAGLVELETSAPMPKETREFIAKRALAPEGDRDRARRLDEVRRLLYTTQANLPEHVEVSIPAGYEGPQVRFQGSVYAEILTNIFYHNLNDAQHKVDERGMYHTSTPGSSDFGSYQGFGTYREGGGTFSNQVWARDLGRALQELVAFGSMDEAKRCVDFCLDQARLWADTSNEKLKINGRSIPPHWCRNITDPNTIETLGCWENDGHGLIMLFVYNTWRRLPEQEQAEWLRARWDDIKMAGDWIEWQFQNPDLSRATNVLFSDSECAFGYGNVTPGYSVFADSACREGLLGFSDMAESTGEEATARAWRVRAAKMKDGIESYYIYRGSDRYPPVWRIDDAGWAYQSGLLGPLMHLADRRGLAPEDDDPLWRQLNERAFDRLIAKWSGMAGNSNDPWWFDNSEEPPFRDTPDQQFTPVGSYGIAMGYGQGFVTQAALLLDRMDLARVCLEWLAREVYYADHEPYLVPEGVEVNPTGDYWFRTGDLGNGVQQGEVLKVIRVVLGIDDNRPGRLRIIPRAPGDWSEVVVKDYPVHCRTESGLVSANVSYELVRRADRQSLTVAASKAMPALSVRLGPFAALPSEALLDGQAATTRVEASGDSVWLWFDAPAGRRELTVEALGLARGVGE